MTDPAGVIEYRRGALERVRFLLADRDHASASLVEVESLMTGVVDEFGLTALVDSITGLSVLGAAAILAETGDPTTFTGRTTLTGQGPMPRSVS